MFKIDIKTIRETRQSFNYAAARNSGFDDKQINVKAMNRVQREMGLSRQEVLIEAKINPKFAKILSMYTAKNSSRQGSLDEKIIIEGVANYLSRYGILIENYGTNDKVPIRGTELVLPRKEAKKKYEKNKMMKSIDFGGLICDDIRIEGFAKVCIGKGGHQDNVFHEAAEFMKWAKEFGKSNVIYTVLLDTDQDTIVADLKKLKESLGKNNIWVVNHVQLQEQLISLKKEN